MMKRTWFFSFCLSSVALLLIGCGGGSGPSTSSSNNSPASGGSGTSAATSGSTSGSSAASNSGQPQSPSGPAMPIPAPSGSFTVDHAVYTIKTSDAVVMGYYQDGYDVDLAGSRRAHAHPTTRGVQTRAGTTYHRYTRFVSGLMPGANNVVVICTQNGQEVGRQTVTITYDANLDINGRPLMMASAVQAGAVLVDLFTYTPVAVLPKQTNISYVLGSDPHRSFAFSNPGNAKLWKFDATTLQQGTELGSSLTPIRTYADGSLLLAAKTSSESVLLRSDTGEVVFDYSGDSGYHDGQFDVSENGRYVAWTLLGQTGRTCDVRRRDLQTGEEVLLAHEAPVREVLQKATISDQGDVLVLSYSYAIGAITHVRIGADPIMQDGLEDFVSNANYNGRIGIVWAAGNPAIGLPALYRYNLDNDQLEKKGFPSHDYIQSYPPYTPGKKIILMGGEQIQVYSTPELNLIGVMPFVAADKDANYGYQFSFSGY